MIPERKGRAALMCIVLPSRVRSLPGSQTGPRAGTRSPSLAVSVAVLAAALAVLLGAGAALAGKPCADVPLGHWSYALLERLESRGVVDIDLSTLPVARTDVARAVREALEARESGGLPVELTERESWALDGLADEFLRGEVDTPVFSTEDERASFGLGVSLLTQGRYGPHSIEKEFWSGSVPGGITPERRDGGATLDVAVDSDDDSKLDFAADIDYELWGGFGDAIGFYADSQLLLGGQEGARQVRLSNRVRTWRGISSESHRAYLKLERPNYSVVLGRRGTAWGRSRWGRLLISGNAPTFDQLSVRCEVGALSFEAMHGFVEYVELGNETDLGEAESVFLAGHRLVIEGDRGSLGLAEAVVYSSELPDPVYVNPLMPFYLAQHNERENDNIQWSVDGVYRFAPGLTAYGEFLIDDLQYERHSKNPDKYGLTLGGAWYGAAAGFDVELTVEYTNVRNWTYTHKHTEHRFAHDGLPIGFELGPDADRVRAELALHPVPELTVGVAYEHARKGEGSLDAQFVSGEGKDDTFPSGTVEATDRLSLEVGYQGLDRLTAGLGFAYETVANAGNAPGENGDDVEFWAGVEVRM